MANLKSSIKDVRRTRTRTARNRAQMTRLRTALRAVRVAATRDAAVTALREASALLDRAGRGNLIHRGNASRHKSRLALFVNAKYPAAKK